MVDEEVPVGWRKDLACCTSRDGVGFHFRYSQRCVVPRRFSRAFQRVLCTTQALLSRIDLRAGGCARGEAGLDDSLLVGGVRRFRGTGP